MFQNETGVKLLSRGSSQDHFIPNSTPGTALALPSLLGQADIKRPHIAYEASRHIRTLSPMWTNEQHDAVWSYSQGKISREKLLTVLELDETKVVEDVRRELLEAIPLHAMRHVEAALYVASCLKVEPPSILDLICKLLNEDWHINHEDLIGALQELADPLTIPALQAAIELKPKLAYLSYDDYGSYYKKCMWALHDIGTAEAFAVIEQCAHSDDEALRDQAIYRLSKIDR